MSSTIYNFSRLGITLDLYFLLMREGYGGNKRESLEATEMTRFSQSRPTNECLALDMCTWRN